MAGSVIATRPSTGEDCAWEHFLKLCKMPGPYVLEFSGMGPHAREVRDTLIIRNPRSGHMACAPRGRMQSAGPAAEKTVPFPYPLAPVEYAVPAIHCCNRRCMGYYLEHRTPFSCRTAGVFQTDHPVRYILLFADLLFLPAEPKKPDDRHNFTPHPHPI